MTTEVAFTRSVKAEQQRRGSRAGYARLEEKGGWPTTVTADLAAFLAERDTAFLATASADGRPYVQHRGGPPGFIRALDERTLAFADFGGNRQYITLGNLAENPRALLFLIDFATQRRIKIWGRAEAIEDRPDLTEALADPGYGTKPERAIVFHIEAWDVNCPQHIVPRYSAKEVERLLAPLRRRISELEARCAANRRSPGP
jgi:predicted pyridoxine 5'-phosphate oxidase superfamily flavin-nucleotide-binding protein